MIENRESALIQEVLKYDKWLAKASAVICEKQQRLFTGGQVIDRSNVRLLRREVLIRLK